MKPITVLFVIACAGLLYGCASSTPPAELINAREAYHRASTGQAAQLAPAELHKAQLALTAAENSYREDPESYLTRDLAYVADRRAKMAEALAVTVAGNAVTAKANMEYQNTQTQIVKDTKDDLAASELSGQMKTEQIALKTDQVAKKTVQLAAAENARLDAETARLAADNARLDAERARLDAEKRATAAQGDLARLAAVKEEERGLVVTLSGSVLFASNASTLLPSARDRLNDVADALMATKERKITVEGHTDSQGSSAYNLDLSQRRAEAVREFIVGRGYPPELISAQGIGLARPVANNASAEGRANNRRVEIIIDRSTGY